MLDRDRRGAEADRGRHVRHLHAPAARRSPRSASRRIRGRRSASTTPARRSEGERAAPDAAGRPRRLVDGRARADLVRGALARGRRRAVGSRSPRSRSRPIAADQLTKHIVTSQLALDDGVHVVGPFWIHHVQNSGIAFGLFSSATAVVIVVNGGRGRLDARLLRPLGRPPPGAARRARARDRRQHARTCSTASGSGYVTDFLDFRYWPAFNLADSFIVDRRRSCCSARSSHAEREPRGPRRMRDATARP